MKGWSVEVDPNPTVTQTGLGTPHDQRTLGSPDATLVTLLIRQPPQMIERLAEAHANDGHGRCKSYSSTTGRYLYPCPVRRAVDEARRQLRAQTSRRGPVPTGSPPTRGAGAVSGWGDKDAATYAFVAGQELDRDSACIWPLVEGRPRCGECPIPATVTSGGPCSARDLYAAIYCAVLDVAGQVIVGHSSNVLSGFSSARRGSARSSTSAPAFCQGSRTGRVPAPVDVGWRDSTPGIRVGRHSSTGRAGASDRQARPVLLPTRRRLVRAGNVSFAPAGYSSTDRGRHHPRHPENTNRIPAGCCTSGGVVDSFRQRRFSRQSPGSAAPAGSGLRRPAGAAPVLGRSGLPPGPRAGREPAPQ